MNTVRQSTIDLVAGFEGFVAHPYQDIGKVWSIGYGFTALNGAPVTRATPPVTVAQAQAVLSQKLQSFGSAVNRLLKRPLNQNQWDAVVSFSYNLGIGALMQSTLLRNINAGIPVASHNFTDWDKDRRGGKLSFDQGLFNRRSSEFAVFNS